MSSNTPNSAKMRPSRLKAASDSKIDARQIEMSRLDDGLTEINEKIVDPSIIKLNCGDFLNPLNSLDL